MWQYIGYRGWRHERNARGAYIGGWGDAVGVMRPGQSRARDEPGMEQRRARAEPEPELSLSRESWSLSKMEGRPKELEPKQNRGEALRAEPEQPGGRPWK